MHARIVIIHPCYNRGRWQVNLTDGLTVWQRRHFVDAGAALAHVRALLAGGYRPAFPSALADLAAEASQERTAA